MCGVPFHKADVYVGRLVEKGIKVAICEQVSDPKESAGLVKREVTRVVTPGTVTDASILTEGKNNYLMSVYLSDNVAGIAIADISTGEVSATYSFGKDYLTVLRNEIGAYQPSEIIFNVKKETIKDIVAFASERFSSLITDNAGRLFGFEKTKELCRRHFKDDSDKLTEAEMILAAGALLAYIEETQKTDITFARGINVYQRGQYLDLDLNTIRNLELVEAMRVKSKRGSLLWVLDKTKTAMGSRFLKTNIENPLTDMEEINTSVFSIKFKYPVIII